MESLRNLLQWWNLLFALPLAVGVVFSVVSAVGFALSGSGSGVQDVEDGGEGDLDTDASAEAGDADAGADAELEADADTGDTAGADSGADTHDLAHVEHGEVSHEAHAEHHTGDGDHHESLLTQLLEAFGIGRGVPISVMLPFCMMLWGVLGLVSNQALHPILRLPALYVWLSMVISLMGTSLIARGVAGTVGRILQAGQVSGVSRERLIGATGVAVFPIDRQGGVADVRDTVGTVHRIACRVAEHGSPIAAGTPVLVTDYEVETGRYLVEENPFADNTSQQEVAL